MNQQEWSFYKDKWSLKIKFSNVVKKNTKATFFNVDDKQTIFQYKCCEFCQFLLLNVYKNYLQ